VHCSPCITTNGWQTIAPVAARPLAERRLTVHLLNLSRVPRGETEFRVMDPYPAVGSFAVRLRVRWKPAAVRWEPEGQAADRSWREGLLTASVPGLQIHGMLVIA
jgi:hypothetical protein